MHITDGLVNWDATNDSIDFLEFKVNAEILDSKDIITTDQCVCAQIDHDDFKSSGFVYIKDIISPPPGLKNMFLQTRVKISFSNYVKDAELTFLNRDKYADISYIDSKDVFLHLYYECVDNAYFFLDVESVSGKHIGFDISISINKEKFAFD
ncbi:hypothetical protein FACS189459_4130 [Bacilli bacterium]|nr:hypothetical protein FACS189459_4130 [Bacilli bacterium]